MKKIDDKPKEPIEKNTEPQVDEAMEWKNKYLRAMADYQNLEKRSGEQVQQARLFAAEVVISRLLPVVDTFDKVHEHIKDVGFELAYKQLHGVLEEQGVEKMDVIGKPFNPHEMECVEVVDLPAQAGGENDTVVEETLSGYRFRGKVLRVAHVKVGKQKQKEPNV